MNDDDRWIVRYAHTTLALAENPELRIGVLREEHKASAEFVYAFCAREAKRYQAKVQSANDKRTWEELLDAVLPGGSGCNGRAPIEDLGHLLRIASGKEKSPARYLMTVVYKHLKHGAP